MTKPKTTPKDKNPKTKKLDQATEPEVTTDSDQVSVEDTESTPVVEKGADTPDPVTEAPVGDDAGTAEDIVKTTTPSAGITEGKVTMIPIDKIEIDDTTYRFRADLRVASLVESIKSEGIQIPVIVRRASKGRYQIVSGFRRVTAAHKAGLDAVPAIVRDLSDADASKASVLENTNRKTYSDIERALVLKAHRDRGLGDDEAVVGLLKLTPRQQQHLLSLLTLPDVVQEAIDEPAQHFTATHGLVLRQLSGKYPDLDWDKWVKAINDGKLSIRDLRKAVVKKHGSDGGGKAFTGVFREKGTDATKGVFRFKPVKVIVGQMTDDEKKTLKAELELLLDTLA